MCNPDCPSGTVVAITGGTGGLGAQVAIGLAELGMRVAVCGSTDKSVSEMVPALSRFGSETICVRADVTNPLDMQLFVQATIEKWQRLDALLTFAGVAQHTPAHLMTKDEWNRVISTDLDGVFFACQAAGTVMIQQHGGSIVNISSLSGSLGYVNEVAYSAAKGGVNMLTKSLAVEWARYGVRVNAVAPTWFYSSMSASVLNDTELAERELNVIPLGRFGDGRSDLLGPILFLISPTSNFVTGHILAVDGGKLARLANE